MLLTSLTISGMFVKTRSRTIPAIWVGSLISCSCPRSLTINSINRFCKELFVSPEGHCTLAKIHIPNKNVSINFLFGCKRFKVVREFIKIFFSKSPNPIESRVTEIFSIRKRRSITNRSSACALKKLTLLLLISRSHLCAINTPPPFFGYFLGCVWSHG